MKTKALSAFICVHSRLLRIVSRLLTLAALVLLFRATVGSGFQGMAVPNRAPRPARTIETSLPPIQVDFRDIAEEAGLTAVTVSGDETRKKYIIEATGTGVVIFDYDNDGLMDIFLVNAGTLAGGPQPTSHLYRNKGNLKFEDVTRRAG